ncbi:MAG: phosphodiesterase [Acidobacteria bacterium]|nr:MAG: phosphodiesterase [Acidobacteriota bacterium]
MRSHVRKAIALLVLGLWAVASFASAYNAQPKLVVIVVVDQLRGDLLERYHDDFGEGGFRLLMDHGAWFTSSYYNYSTTKTAPGHATIGTGTYALGHGILANEWWDPKLRRIVSSVEDVNTRPLGLPAGVEGERSSASPHNLQTDTIGDELKLATNGQAKVFGVALKDRAAILPVGFSANGAFFIDPKSGVFITSTYYMPQAPAWLVRFNAGKTRESYLNREVKDATGKVLRSTAPAKNSRGKDVSFYELVGSTPWGSDYTIDLARQIIDNEKLGTGPVTDLISISFSSPDILGHRVGPDSPEDKLMLLALDRSLAGFFQYLDARVGKGNWAVALSADHGIAPMTDYASRMRIPAPRFNTDDLRAQLNQSLKQKHARDSKYVTYIDYPTVHLDSEAFEAVNETEADAEKTVADLLLQLGFRYSATKTQMAAGNIKNSVFRQQVLNSYSPLAGWYVFGLMGPFELPGSGWTTHAVPYSYDAHVPLAFYGTAFRPGIYRESVEPVDLAVTLSSLLRTNKPASAVGRVLSEAFADNPGVGIAASSASK